ncbi:MAG TPA: hypothetical protein VER04_00435 [Polyangiaceae bacterium]|nr:hypothetical protein [Polyangiaceae bacterium]
MFPINKRFHELCRTLKIDPGEGSARHEEGTREFYNTLRKKLSRLLGNRYCLVSGALRVEDQHTQGLAATLRRELNGSGGKTEVVKESNARTAVYRLHGFVETAGGGWVLPKRREAEEDAPMKSAEEQFEQSVSVIPREVRERIYELCAQRGDLMSRYLEQAAKHLQGEAEGLSLPGPPWDERYESKRGHEFAEKFLERAKKARSEVLLAAVDFYITGAICQSILLDRLKNHVRVRILIFDFVRGDTSHVARMVRRSPQVLCALSNDTVEALLWLRDEARAAGVLENLEIGLVDRDPQGRWYIIDPLSEEGRGAYAFTVPRASGTAEKAADSGGGWETTLRVIQSHAREVERLWTEAQPFETWLPNYESWRARPETKTLLGE